MKHLYLFAYQAFKNAKYIKKIDERKYSMQE